MADTAQVRNGTVNGETESTSPVFTQDSSSSQAFDRPDPEDTAVAAEGQVTEGDREPVKGTPTPEPNSENPADSTLEENAHKSEPEPEKPNEEENEIESNEQSQGPEPADKQETREADETSEGTNETVPARAEEDKSAKSVSNDTTNNKDGTGERPVRQQLKKTSIAEAAHTESPADPDRDHPMATESSQPSSSGKGSQPSSAEGRGRVRKRSLDDVDGDEETLSKDEDDTHRRKRSRDSKDDSKSADIQGAEDTANTTTTETTREETATTPPPEKTDELEKLRSPKKKRSREQLENDASKATDKPEITQESSAEGEREAKRPRDNSQERNKETKTDEDAKSSLPNPFSNTSSASPFASVAKPSEEPSKEETKKEQPMTSSSAFASSSLAAFAGSDKSPFGSIGTGGSVFKSASTTPAPAGETKDSGAPSSAFAKSAFGAAAAAPSAFGSIGGVFGGSAFGSAFGGSALKPAGGLTSFASPSTPAVLGSSSKTKAFGSTSDDEKEDEEEQGGEDGGKEFEGLEDEKPDERFTKQDTETGEENEETFYTCRAKLFQFDGKEWKERGVGNLKVNVTLPSDEAAEPEDGGESGQASGKKTARLIMRSDGVHRVILNTPLYKEIKFGTPTGNLPTGKLVNVAGVDNKKIVPFLIRTPSPEIAKELYYSVQELLPQL